MHTIFFNNVPVKVIIGIITFISVAGGTYFILGFLIKSVMIFIRGKDKSPIYDLMRKLFAEEAEEKNIGNYELEFGPLMIDTEGVHRCNMTVTTKTVVISYVCHYNPTNGRYGYINVEALAKFLEKKINK